MLLCVFSSGMLAPAGAPHTAADVQKEMAEAYNGIIMAVISILASSDIHQVRICGGGAHSMLLRVFGSEMLAPTGTSHRGGCAERTGGDLQRHRHGSDLHHCKFGYSSSLDLRTGHP